MNAKPPRAFRKCSARIAPRYDFLNHLLSFSLDKIWRRRTARHFLHILRRPDARVLDLCCGTGDLAFALDRARSKAIGLAVATKAFAGDRQRFRSRDAGARARKEPSGGANAVVFAAADAMHLPFPDASFDLVTTAFGFRNLANYEARPAGIRARSEAGRGTRHSGIFRTAQRPVRGTCFGFISATFCRASAAQSQVTARPTNISPAPSRNFLRRWNSQR